MGTFSYKVTNWAEYNESLIKRGSLTMWLPEDIEHSWVSDEATGTRGRPKTTAKTLCVFATT